MTTTKEELIEAMARVAVCCLLEQADSDGRDAPYVDERDGLAATRMDGGVDLTATMREVLAAIEPAGLAIVPKEATAEMQKRGAMEHAMGFQRFNTTEMRATDIYRAMVEEGRVK